MIFDHFRDNCFHLPLLKDVQTFREHDVALSQKGLEQIRAGTIHQSMSDLVWELFLLPLLSPSSPKFQPTRRHCCIFWSAIIGNNVLFQHQASAFQAHVPTELQNPGQISVCCNIAIRQTTERHTSWEKPCKLLALACWDHNTFMLLLLIKLIRKPCFFHKCCCC